MPTLILAVAAGGAIGAVARYAAVLLFVRVGGAGFPWGILAANLIGSFLMGLLAALLDQSAVARPELRLFLLTGLLGGFTTFSSFSIDTLQMIERGAFGLALIYTLASMLGGLGLVWSGWRLAVALR